MPIDGGPPTLPLVSGISADVDIGVIYTHERIFMDPLVATLSQSGRGLAMRLILVDNHSAEGVKDWESIFPSTTVIHNTRRLGYAENLNRILAASRARYVLLLNTDMHFEPREQCIAKMVQFMNRRPDCGIAGCRLHHADGAHAPSARRFQTPAVIAARRLGLGRWMRRTLAEYFYEQYAPDESWECDWLSGCFLMLRREAFEDAGYFDTGFAKYLEDVDFCLRMARAGWRVMYNGGTYCYHLEQRASRRVLSADAMQHLRSYLRWVLKWGFAPDPHASSPAAAYPRRAA